MDVTLAGKNVGRLDEHNKKIQLDLSPEEVDEILRQPPPPSSRKSKELTYTIKI